MTNGLIQVDFDSIRKAKISLGISVRFVKKTLGVADRREGRGTEWCGEGYPPPQPNRGSGGAS